MSKISDYINASFQQLVEALDLTTAKKYTRMAKGSYEKLYPEIFGTGPKNHRVYFDMEVDEAELENLVSETREKVIEKLKEIGAEDIQYVKGYYKKDKQTMKIGKALADDSKLMNAFANDVTRQTKLKICLSKHPYDIAGMSTGRKWESCMTLVSGSNCHYVKEEVKLGTLVAYLLKPKDLNITAPLARVLVKPFKDKKYVVLGVSKNVYGIQVPAFRTSVEKFVYEKFNKERITTEEYQKRMGSLEKDDRHYSDGDESTYTSTSAIEDAIKNDDVETFSKLISKMYK